MAGLDILGGLGKGLMQGSQFVQQKNMQDEQLALQQQQAAQTKQYIDARLEMLQEDQTFQRQDRARQQAERDRTDAYGRLQMGVRENYKDRPREEQEAIIVEQALKAGIMTPKEFEASRQQMAQLRKTGIADGMKQAFLTGDTAPLSKAYGVQVSLRRGKDAFGNDDLFLATPGPGGQPVEMSFSQLASLEGIDTFAKMQEQQLKNQELRSKSLENEAQAGAARASAGASGALAGKYAEETRGQRLENEGLASLPPRERQKTKGGSSLPSAVQEAEWLRTATPDQQAAYREVKKITNEPDIAKEAVRVLTNSVRPITPEQAVAQVRQVYQQAGAQPVQVRSPAEASQLPPGTTFQTPDGRTMRVPAR